MRRYLFWLFFLLVLAGPASAQESAGPSPGAEAFPGLAEIVPRLTGLIEEKAQDLGRLASLQETTALRSRLERAEQQQREVGRRIAALGDLTTWNAERLLEVREVVSEQRDLLKDLLDTLSARLLELEEMRQQWREKLQFWKDWEAALSRRHQDIPGDALNRAQTAIQELLEGSATALTPLLSMQERITQLHEENLGTLNRIDASLSALRQEIFSRTDIPFTRRDFYRQFDSTLWRELTRGIASAQRIDPVFLREHAWLIALQVFLAAGLGLFIRRQRQQPDITREWEFILRHPWATGIFVAVSALSFLYPLSPALWRWLLWALAASSAAVLLNGLLANPRKIFMVNLLALLFILSLGLQIISLPQPLYRLYLSLLSLFGAPLLFGLAWRNRQRRDGRSDGFTLALKGGGAVLLVSLLAQVGGFGALASRLIEASVETVFLALFAAMAVRLGRGGIDFLLSRELFQKRPFFRQFGDELAARLKWAFEVVAYGFAVLYLLVVWRVFGSVADAWRWLLGVGFTWGESWVSVQMLVLILLVLYAAIVFSWVIRAILEAELFPRRGLDRGVRDSIKKLLHYFLIVLGFLLAISLAGIELKNFTVLAGALGVGLGFGLQNIVNNFVSGLILLFERPVKVGDVIVLEDEWGTVRKIGLRSTIVETLDEAEIIVPNSDLISEKVTNWTLTTRVARVIVGVGVAYGSEVEKVMRILKEAASDHPDVLDDPAPSALFMEFGDSSLNFELRCWIADVGKRLVVKSELGQYIDRRFRAEGVEIPFPQRDLHLRSIEGRAVESWKSGGDRGKGDG